MKFLTPAKLKLEFVNDDNIKMYSLKQNLILDDDKYTKELIIVPKELFLTDLASIPKLVRWLYSPSGKYTRASIIHDFCYSQRDIKRKTADKIFRKCMKLDKVDFFTRWIFYFAVRIGASSHKS